MQKITRFYSFTLFSFLETRPGSLTAKLIIHFKGKPYHKQDNSVSYCQCSKELVSLHFGENLSISFRLVIFYCSGFVMGVFIAASV